MDPYTLSKSRWPSRKNTLKGKNNRGIRSCWCSCKDRFDRHHVRPRIAWELKNEYGLPRGREALWRVRPGELLEWFWERGEEQDEMEGEVEDGDGDAVFIEGHRY